MAKEEREASCCKNMQKRSILCPSVPLADARCPTITTSHAMHLRENYVDCGPFQPDDRIQPPRHVTYSAQQFRESNSSSRRRGKLIKSIQNLHSVFTHILVILALMPGCENISNAWPKPQPGPARPGDCELPSEDAGLKDLVHKSFRTLDGPNLKPI